MTTRIIVFVGPMRCVSADFSTGNDECVLSQSVHYLGGSRVIAPNSYLGIINSNLCIDTLIFYNDTTRALNDESMGLIVDVPPGVQNVLGSDEPFQASDFEYFSSSVDPLCYLNGEGWYANLHYFIYPDSVWMQLRFWTLETPPGEFLDSTIVMFYKTK